MATVRLPEDASVETVSDLDLEYLLHRRQLNKGKYDHRWLNVENSAVIHSSTFPAQHPLPQNNQRYLEVPQLYSTPVVLVNEKQAFVNMISHLHSTTELCLDLEANNDHSYLGMTCLIQIATNEVDFLVDVFPTFECVMKDLKSILEDPKIVKYMWGCTNDMLWLKRCFFINATAVLDVQILFQEILRAGVWDDLCESIPLQQKKAWYLKYIGSRVNSTSKEQRAKWEKEAAANPMSYETFVHLFYPSVDIEDSAQVADFRPRDANDEKYKALLKYARDDVHILNCIMNFIKSQNIPRLQDLFARTFDLTKTQLLKTYAKQNYPRCDAYLKSKSAINVPAAVLDVFKCIYSWRSHHASIIDESPAAMFSEGQLASLLTRPPKSAIELDARVRTRQGTLPESIDTWRSTLFSLIHGGEAQYKQIMSTQCHNCRKVEGHAGWGCPEPWNTESTKLNLAEDRKAKSRQNHRRQVNKRNNKKLKLKNSEQS